MVEKIDPKVLREALAGVREEIKNELRRELQKDIATMGDTVRKLQKGQQSSGRAKMYKPDWMSDPEFSAGDQVELQHEGKKMALERNGGVANMVGTVTDDPALNVRGKEWKYPVMFKHGEDKCRESELRMVS
jgi:hypothetical protein